MTVVDYSYYITACGHISFLTGNSLLASLLLFSPTFLPDACLQFRNQNRTQTISIFMTAYSGHISKSIQEQSRKGGNCFFCFEAGPSSFQVFPSHSPCSQAQLENTDSQNMICVESCSFLLAL